MLRSFENFDFSTANREVAKKRYEHYKDRLVQTINSVLAERRKICFLLNFNIFLIGKTERLNKYKQEESNCAFITHSASSTEYLPILNISFLKKNIKNDQSFFKNKLQKEAQMKIEDENKRRQKSQQLKERIEKAKQKEKDLKEGKVVDKLNKAKKFEEIKQKAKQIEEEKMKQKQELHKKFTENLRQKEMNRARIEEERTLYFKRKEEELKRKVKEIKETKSISSIAEDEKRMLILQDLEKKCKFVFKNK